MKILSTALFCISMATIPFYANALPSTGSDSQERIQLAHSDDWKWEKKEWCEKHPRKCHREWCRHHPGACKARWCHRHPEACRAKWCEKHPDKCHHH